MAVQCTIILNKNNDIKEIIVYFIFGNTKKNILVLKSKSFDMYLDGSKAEVLCHASVTNYPTYLKISMGIV